MNLKICQIYLVTLCLSLGTAVLSGCGINPSSQTSTDGAPKTLLALNINNESLDSEESNWRCPSEENVIANNSYDLSQAYAVCINRDDNKKIKVKFSSLFVLKGICVYPFYSGYNSSLSHDTIQLTELAQCLQIPKNTSEVEMSFQNNSTNYIAIVDSNFSSQMNSCLSNHSACPSHAEGFIQ